MMLWRRGLGCLVHRFTVSAMASSTTSSPPLPTSSSASSLPLSAGPPIHIKESIISRNMRLKTVLGDPSVRCQERTLVIMFPFINAKSNMLSKYCDLYHQRGHNVLLVQASLHHFLWPQNGVNVARELLQYLSSNNVSLDVSYYHIHAFSIGAYIYTLVMIELAKEPEKYQNIRDKLKSQVFDSLTIGGFDHMLQGMMTSEKVKSALVKGVASTAFTLYLKLTKPYTEDLLLLAVDFFKHKPLRTPILVYHSFNDTMSNAEVIQETVTTWQKKYGLQVFVKCWDVSLHAGHLKAHPEQYKKTLQAFLNHVQALQTGPKSKL